MENVSPSLLSAANVSSVPQRSPLRYPGGKTWLIPHVRTWITLIEPRLADGSIDFMMTYDHVPEIIDLVDQHGFSAIKVSMDRVHRELPPELVITRNPLRLG